MSSETDELSPEAIALKRIYEEIQNLSEELKFSWDTTKDLLLISEIRQIGDLVDFINTNVIDVEKAIKELET
jgi:hypothetical protein